MWYVGTLPLHDTTENYLIKNCVRVHMNVSGTMGMRWRGPGIGCGRGGSGAEAGIEGVADAIAEEVEAQHGEGDAVAGEG